ncbi:MAG: AMP-binding protein [Actinobacteria bacterium]|nr:AMP-binding protein [Actinomycetota bacterium]MSX10326.1 AMP-binding protein [Actinomycetota bacterium]MSX68940.1 AMP-binding protein [Actinomycetota bacterium]
MTMVMTGEGVSYGTQIHDIAQLDPDGTAIYFIPLEGDDRLVSWRELDEVSTSLAHVLQHRGVKVDDIVAVSLKNSPEHLISCFAIWKVGAVPVPMRWDLPEWERSRVLATMEPVLVIDDPESDLFVEAASASTEPLADVTPPRGWGVCSSGSTGTPKVVMIKTPGLYFLGSPSNLVVETYGPLPQPQRFLVPAPLYHTNGFTATKNLMAGDAIVLLEKFNAAQILDVIERYRVTGFIAATPMLQRLVQVPGIEERDLSSLDWVQQGASPLPIWLGKKWCELVGPEKFYLSYGASEMHGLVTCRGDEWLEHLGTLGRGFTETELRIIDNEGNVLGAGEVGGIYMRTPTGPAGTYIGDNVAPMPQTDDGFVTVGDLGWLDEEGFLFMADRRVDMIVTGAANVFPAEVESALSEHPEILDVVVIGLKDPEWGRRVHAIVQPADHAMPPSTEDVIGFAKERLAPYKVPKTVEFVVSLPRSEAMKLNRAALIAERDGPDEERGPT